MKIKNIVKAAATGSFTLLLAACYGVAYEMDSRSGKVTVTDPDSNPISGLKLTLVKNGFTELDIGTTDENGSAEWEMELETDYDLIIEDEDGEANGGDFGTTEIDIDDTSTANYEDTIVLNEQNT